MISIIVPIYNAETTLARCIESMQEQTYSDFELILVNDGSQDNSLKICNSYAERDKRILIISQLNGGVSAARNAGLDVAKGEYLYFIDPDDYAEPELLATLLAEKKDLVICSYFIEEYDADGCLLNQSEKTVDLNASNLEELLMGDTKLLFPLWNKLFRRECVEKHKLKFLPLSLWEDACFVFEFLKYTNSFSNIKRCLYHYTMQKNKTSLSHPKYIYNRKSQYLSLFRCEMELCVDKKISNEMIIQENYVRLGYNLVSDLVDNIHHPDAELSFRNRVEYVAAVCKEPEVLQLLNSPKWRNSMCIVESKIGIWFLHFFPYEICEVVFGILASIKRKRAIAINTYYRKCRGINT